MWKVNLKTLVAFCVFMMALAVAVPAGAVTRYVPSPYPTIQGAIDASAMTGDEIEVAPGMYNEAINFGGKAIRLYSSGGPNVTTIDATGLSSSVVSCISGEGLNTFLEGFTITGGSGTTDGGYTYGGGMYNLSSSPTVKDCNFTTNSVTGDGGGMYNEESSIPKVINCTFTGNTAIFWGGGMCNDTSSPTVTNCTFSDNEASDGGGMYNDISSPTLTNCTFSGNTTEYDGGGMYNYENSSPTLTNCTFSGNEAANNGGGIYNTFNSSPSLTNCILWGNAPDEILNDDTSSSDITYSDVQGGQPGLGNIDTDPCFVNATAGDFHLLLDSPCIDAGDNISIPGDITTDLNGLPRFIDDLCTVDTGNGTAPVVDMGAYEFLPADIDRSGAVDLSDLARLALQWAETVCGRCDYTNLNCEGAVDFKDLAILCVNWLAGIEPE